MGVTIGPRMKSSQIKKYESIVLSILMDREDARDNDYALYYYVLSDRNIDLKRISAYDFLLRMSKGTLPPFLSITRARRKIQEEYPEVRGELWEKRHKRAEAVKNEMTE